MFRPRIKAFYKVFLSCESSSDMRSSAHLHKGILITKSKSRAEGKKAAVNCVVKMSNINSLQTGKVIRNYWEEGEHDFRVRLGGNFERQSVEYKGWHGRASLCDDPLIDIWVAGVATLHSLL
jgi:hypothetical protein